ncbi:MAG: hypothetical protein H0V77_07385 [Actinobacteria bacterium]|nr:hypothetical protein [Actinomycetota bacterium]
MCSSHATVRGLLHALRDDRGIVVVDTEASPEHLSRSTTEAVDLMLVVAEPYFKSLETARRYSAMGKELGIPRVAVLANKVRNADEEAAVGAFFEEHDTELFAAVPFDAALAAAERRGIAPLDHDVSAPAVASIGEVAERIVELDRRA